MHHFSVVICEVKKIAKHRRISSQSFRLAACRRVPFLSRAGVKKPRDFVASVLHTCMPGKSEKLQQMNKAGRARTTFLS